KNRGVSGCRKATMPRCYDPVTGSSHHQRGAAPMSTHAFDVAVLQMNSGEDKAANIETALRLVDEAAATGARLVVLPEIWTYLGNEEGNRANAELIPGPVTEA